MWFKAPAITLIVWALVVILLLRFYVSGRLGRYLDEANHRSLHQGQIMTGGGFLMFVPLVVVLMWQQQIWAAFLVAGLTVMGAFDDLKSLSAGFRLLVQMVVAALTLWLLDVPLTWWWPVMWLAMVWWLNLFNFMDGANGLVTLHGIVSLSAMIWLVSFPAEIDLIIIGTLLTLLIYLYYNVIRRVLFMGDSGSLPLAFIIALIGLWAWKQQQISLPQLAIVHVVLITDSSWTLVKRIIKRENITQAHRSHVYQQLIAGGFSHVQISSIYAALTVLCCIFVDLIDTFTPGYQWLLMLMVYTIFALIYYQLTRLMSKITE